MRAESRPFRPLSLSGLFRRAAARASSNRITGGAAPSPPKIFRLTGSLFPPPGGGRRSEAEPGGILLLFNAFFSARSEAPSRAGGAGVRQLPSCKSELLAEKGRRTPPDRYAVCPRRGQRQGRENFPRSQRRNDAMPEQAKRSRARSGEAYP